MFHVYKNGICISGVFDAIYTNDPEAAYRQMHTRLTNNRYFYYRAHPDWAKAYSLKNSILHIDMGKPYEQAVTVIAEGEKDPHGSHGLNGCDNHPNDHFGE